MNEHDFRRMALGLEGAIESAHMGHPDFRVNRRIFATLQHDRRVGMVVLTPDEQKTFMRTHPDAFSTAAGAWGRSGCTLVRLSAVDEETLGEALTLAWQQTIAKTGAKKKATKKKATKKK
jgi:hypothetical protein